MTQLSLNLRAHDLPPRWDGDPVDWSPWQPIPAVTICPPPRTQGCGKCGSATRPFTCHGTRTIAYGPNVILKRPGFVGGSRICEGWRAWQHHGSTALS